ncbi:hypothetical protein GF312_07865 [Candidatus Poribacteria bacterium]|nr:hypothetical protein [Candidatus Poribacteria bacterium]
MNNNKPKPAPLEFKPNIEETARRWEAFYEGEIIDRPVVCVTAPIEGRKGARGSDYYERVHGDMDDIIDRALISANATYYGGESVPAFWLSFGPDEISVFTGAELKWSEYSGNTNWSVPYVENWEDAFPIEIQEDHPLWQRMLEFYRRAADKMAGKMLLVSLDLHTNMDLIAAIRGPQQLCLDLIDQPEMIDRAMEYARAIFPKLWKDISEAGRMDEFGYCHGMYSMEGAATLQCDFSCMISPEMFRRWVLPALEEEAEIVKHVVYHWDGPGALVHTEDLLASKGLHTMSYVPGTGHGGHIDYLDLFKKVQAGGKAVQVHGSPDQIKYMHKELIPEKTYYSTRTQSQKEAEELLAWFVKNT